MNMTDTTLYEQNVSEIMKLMPVWIKTVRSRISLGHRDFHLTDEEIMSELTHQCIYLSGTFKVGNYVGYCRTWVCKRTIEAFMKEYVRAVRELPPDNYEMAQQFDEEVDVDELRDIQMYKRSLKDPEKTSQQKIQEKEEKAMLKRLAEEDKNFRKIYKMIVKGMSEREIADVLDMPKTTVHNEIQKFIQKAKETTRC